MHHPPNKFTKFENAKKTNKKKAFIIICFFCGKKEYVKKDHIKRKT